MNKQRVIPLIVATALFMENMDSTVIATSLPAIARDIGTSPLTLKLAITSYLLSLAVFIPASGWTADRFGARRVFSSAKTVGGPAARRVNTGERQEIVGVVELHRHRAGAELHGDRR
ncbi:MAG: MFS transporter, partial [Bradyrhizobium sp.]|uniref:MFS transporter n=1 Tax=Bradyrhizobium sp. TaxID=376 RepID=UPI00391ACF25